MERLLSPRRPMTVAAVLAHLLVAALAGMATWLAYGDVVNTDANCSPPAGPNRIGAITFAGTASRVELADELCRDRPEPEQRAQDGDVLRKDILLAAACGLLLAVGARLGTGLARHHVTRRTGMRLVLGALALAVSDVLENALLWQVVQDPENAPRWIGVVSAIAVTRLLVLCIVGVFAAAGVAAGIAVVFRALLGPALRPQFDRRLRTVDHPTTSMEGRLETPNVARPHARRFLGPDGTPWPSDPPTAGVCFSGGGIRAASFAIGVLHALQERQVLKRFRYMATVSGGGYAAMAWQIASRAACDDPPRPGGEVESEPMSADSPEAAYVRDNARYLWPPVEPGKRWRSTLTFLAVASTALRGVIFNAGLLLTLVFVLSRPLGWLTGSWTFAAPIGGSMERPAEWWHLLAALLQCAAVVVLAWPIVLRWWQKLGSTTNRKVLAGLATTAVGGGSVWFVLLLDRDQDFVIQLSVGWWLVLLGALIAGLWAVRVQGRSAGPGFGFAILGLGVAKLWVDGGFVTGPDGEVTLHAIDAVLRILIVFVVLLVMLAVLRILVSIPRDRSRIVPVLVLLLVEAFAFSAIAVVIVAERSWGAAIPLALLAMAAIAYGGLTIRRLPSPPAPFVGGTVNAARTIVALVAALSGAVALGFALWRWDAVAVGGTVTDFQRWAVLAGLILLVYAFVDQKWWSPHKFYKRRLSATFSPVRSADGDASPLPFRIRTSLASWAKQVPGQPELLMCAAVYDTERLRPREIQALPFVFSSSYVGSGDLGYARTYDLDAVLGAQNQGYGTVQAAAAISGAAVSPAIGAVRLASLSQVFAFFNLRQGVWLPSPASVNELRHQGGRTPDPTRRWVRTRRLGYLLKEISGRYDTEDRFVYVNDGGQFDNLGMYELFVRRCRLVYAFDASGDSPQSVGSLLGTLKAAHDRLGMDFGRTDATEPLDVSSVESARNVWRDALLADLVTALPEAGRPWANGRATNAAVAVFSAWYPAEPGATERQRATVVFAKARLALDEHGQPPPTDPVLDYAAIDGKFPGNSTGDQFVDDIQFDAYVALGRWVAGDALARHPFPPAPTGALLVGQT